jgi:hypothetical protein
MNILTRLFRNLQGYKSCIGIPDIIVRPLDDPLTLREKPFDQGRYQVIGREIIGRVHGVA